MNTVDYLKREIRYAQEKITKIQNECSHPESVKVVTGSTITCGLCQKKWTEKL
jgi:hypothetical protein